MAIKEKEIYKWLKTYNGPIKINLHRIESGGTELGIPDIYFESYNKTGWIESKRTIWPIRETTPIKIKFQPGQLNFINNHNILTGLEFSEAFLIVVDNYKRFWMVRALNIREEYRQKEFIRVAYKLEKVSEAIELLTNR